VFDYTRLLVNDMAKSIQFYTEVLGYPLQTGGPNDVYSEISTGSHVLALFSRQAMLKALGEDDTSSTDGGISSVVLSFAVADVDAVCAEIEAKGVTVIAPPTDRPDWMMRTAHFYDPDGNIVEINKNL
jgi:predicted enzyme related to lactoylglutathione lyase